MAADLQAVHRIGASVADTLHAAVQQGGARTPVPELVSLLAAAGDLPA
jgi:hypothetical protein